MMVLMSQFVQITVLLLLLLASINVTSSWTIQGSWEWYKGSPFLTFIAYRSIAGIIFAIEFKKWITIIFVWIIWYTKISTIFDLFNRATFPMLFKVSRVALIIGRPLLFFKLITLLTSSVVLLVAGDMMFPSNSDAFIDFDFVFVVNFVTFLLLLLILDSLSYNSSKKVVFFLFLVADEYDGVALLIFLVTRLRFCFLP